MSMPAPGELPQTAAVEAPDIIQSRGVVVDRRRLNDDSDDSDVSLTGL
jgi:hypothetical protein